MSRQTLDLFVFADALGWKIAQERSFLRDLLPHRTEVETLLGDPTKAKEKLGWTPRTTFAELVKEMIEADYTSARKDSLVKMAGFQAFDHHE